MSIGNSYKLPELSVSGRVVIYTSIMCYNLIFSSSPLSLVVTLLQIIIVLYYIIHHDIPKALLFHLVFIMLSMDTTSAISIDDGASTFYNYGKIKLIGPVGINHLIGGVIFFLLIINKKKRLPRVFFYKVYKLLIGLGLSGTIIGLFGLLFLDYKFRFFLTPAIYIFNGIIYSYCLLCVYSPSFIKELYKNVFCLLVSSAYAATLTFCVFGVRSKYATEEALLYNEIYFLVPTLIIALLQKSSHRRLIVGALVCYFVNLALAGRGGFFLNLVIVLVLAIWFYSASHKISTKRLVVPFLMIIIAVTIAPIITEYSKLSAIKFKEMTSLTNLLFEGGSLSDRITSIPDSPATRISEFANLFYGVMISPLNFIIGKGYGGYYEDYLNLLAQLDLIGGYTVEEESIGKFYTAHSALPCLLLYNGFVGIFFTFRLGFLYIKRIKYSYMAYAGFTLFIYGFYYNALLLVVCLCFLFSLEYKLPNDKKIEDSIC